MINISIINIIVIAISLAMDAVTSAIFNSIYNSKHIFYIKISIIFGIFQFLMTFLGYHFGSFVSLYLFGYKYIFTSIIYFYIGLNIIISDENNLLINNNISLIIIAILTSIDAFFIGITLRLFNSNIMTCSLIIGLITFILCYIGCIISNYIFSLLPKVTYKIGGLLLCLISIYYLCLYIIK